MKNMKKCRAPGIGEVRTEMLAVAEHVGISWRKRLHERGEGPRVTENRAD